MVIEFSFKCGFGLGRPKLHLLSVDCFEKIYALGQNYTTLVYPKIQKRHRKKGASYPAYSLF